jgi:hypothetical protein
MGVQITFAIGSCLVIARNGWCARGSNALTDVHITAAARGREDSCEFSTFHQVSDVLIVNLTFGKLNDIVAKKPKPDREQILNHALNCLKEFCHTIY